ncbi:hypothetical protein [Streptomyces sp. NPDC058657]|uniref:hypothetical protein n=1 Tax=unclassified Streptomyces TaxID=2593676 RepID=UPI0036697D39
MIPRLRTRCTALLAAALLWCALPDRAYAADPATPAAREAEPAARGTAEPAPGRLAGRQAGAGRIRPGRAWEPHELLRPAPVSVPRTLPSPRPPASRPATRPRVRQSTGPARVRQAAPEPFSLGFRPLPLGAGIVLVGLGLGFLAMRLRRQ